MKYVVALVLLTASAYAEPAPEFLQTPQDMNTLLNECVLGMVHNPRGIYVPESRAERVCACGVSKMSKWATSQGTIAIPFAVEKGAIGSCASEIGPEPNHA